MVYNIYILKKLKECLVWQRVKIILDLEESLALFSLSFLSQHGCLVLSQDSRKENLLQVLSESSAVGSFGFVT